MMKKVKITAAVDYRAHRVLKTIFQLTRLLLEQLKVSQCRSRELTRLRCNHESIP